MRLGRPGMQVRRPQRKPGRCGGDRHRAPAPGPRNRAHFGSAEGAYSRRHQGSACPTGGPMSGLTELSIWNDPALRDALSWYVAVAENRRPAKFRIAATVPTKLDLSADSEEALWIELERLTGIFLGRWQATATARRCRPTQWGRACSTSAVRSPGACSPTAISAPGTAASTA